MKRFTIIILTLCTYNFLIAQNLYPKKLDNCPTESFCLDCGDIKANVDTTEFKILLNNLKSSNNLAGIKGRVMFQILVDASGKACVLSHTDVSDHIISRNIVTALNNFNGFIPPKTQDKIEERTSFNMSFEIIDETISARVERVDMNAFKKSFDKPNSPEIYNKNYVYKNENLKKYKITVWNAVNSELPDNRNDHITIDKKGIIWLASDDMLVKFDGNKFIKVAPQSGSIKNPFEVYTIASDDNNRKWIYGESSILSFNDKEWTLYDPKVTGLNEVRRIIFNEKSNEVFFCSGRGLTIFKNGIWTYFNKDKKYPFDDVYFAKRDSKNQLWIGTFEGSYLIDSLGKCIKFNETNKVLKGQCITAMDEDEKGNLYFCLYEYGSQPPGTINRNDGIAIRTADGNWKQYTTSNSGMPFNNATDILYDKRQQVLWVSTDRAGLVRFNLKDEWENYHPENSEIPTSYISDMAFDNNGILYLATRQGVVKVELK